MDSWQRDRGIWDAPLARGCTLPGTFTPYNRGRDTTDPLGEDAGEVAGGSSLLCQRRGLSCRRGSDTGRATPDNASRRVADRDNGPREFSAPRPTNLLVCGSRGGQGQVCFDEVIVCQVCGYLHGRQGGRHENGYDDDKRKARCGTSHCYP